MIDLAQNVYELKEIRTYFENIENAVREFYYGNQNEDGNMELYKEIKKIKREIEDPVQKEENKNRNEKKIRRKNERIKR